MKRISLLLVLALLLTALPAQAERTVYADQDGVHVFSQNEKVGLMAADGHLLADPVYDCIEPFDGTGFAIVWKNKKAGLLRRDGTLMVDCSWERIYIKADWMHAELYNGYVDRSQLIDLETGDVLFDGRYYYHQFEDVLCVEEYMPDAKPYRYRTSVYNADMTLCFETDYEIADVSETFFLAGHDLDRDDWYYGPYTILDHDGNVVMADLYEASLSDAGIVEYSKLIENPLQNALESIGYSYNRIGKAVMRRFKVDKPTAKKMLRFLEDCDLCGVLTPDGRQIEMKGDSLQESGVDGLWLLCYDQDYRSYDYRYIYVDDEGTQAILGVYEYATGFIDGHAVVSEDGKTRHIIDADGCRASELEWDDRASWELPGYILANINDEYSLIDHHGAFITDEHFVGPDGEPIIILRDKLRDDLLTLKDKQGQFVLFNEKGQEIMRCDAERFYIQKKIGDAAVAYMDGKEGLLCVHGDKAGQWLIEPADGYFIWYSNYGQCVERHKTKGESFHFAPDGEVLSPCYR